MTRTAKVVRATAETDIGLSMDLDGTGAADVETGVGFFDHMLCALARHSMIDLTLRVKGDTYVDDHHTVEDTGIVMGQALREALGDKRGIRRFGSVMVPLDEDVDPLVVTCRTHYVRSFASAVWRDNVYGVQFHPEKSSAVGLTILRNYVDLVRGGGR